MLLTVSKGWHSCSHFMAHRLQSKQYSVSLVFQMLQTFKCLLLFYANINVLIDHMPVTMCVQYRGSWKWVSGPQQLELQMDGCELPVDVGSKPGSSLRTSSTINLPHSDSLSLTVLSAQTRTTWEYWKYFWRPLIVLKSKTFQLKQNKASVRQL